MSKRRHDRDATTNDMDEESSRKRLRQEGSLQSATKENSLFKNKSRISTPHSKLSTDEASSTRTCFYKKRLLFTVSIPPSGLRDTNKSIEKSLSRMLLRYSHGLGGTMIAFDKIQILDDGLIINDLPHIHYSVACDVLVFTPSIGQRLTGKVTKSFHSHLSLVAYNYFTTSIPAESLRSSGFDFDHEKEQWYAKGSSAQATNRTLDDGQDMEFQVDKIFQSAGTVSLQGSKPSLVSTSYASPL